VETHYFAEKNSPSDDQLFIHEIHYSNNDFVESGKKLITIEGSKAVFEIEMPLAGYVQFYVEPSSQVPIGQALFSTSPQKFQHYKVPEQIINYDTSTADTKLSTKRFSKAAIKLITENNISETAFNEYDFVTSEIVLDKLSNRQNDITRGQEIKNFTSVAFVGGGHGAEVLISRLNIVSQSNLVTGYFDLKQTSNLHGFNYLGSPSKKEIFLSYSKSKFEALVITVTSNMKFRKEVSEIARQLDIPLASFIDTRASVAETATIEEGCIILDSARVGHNAHLYRNVFLSGFVNIEHHCSVGQDSTFGPGVMFSGGVKVGSGCSFGSNIAVEPRVEIGSNCKIASGSILTSNVPNDTVVKLKTNIVFRDKSPKII
jgi:acetyltransferase-like isoleucine patch superfamily enzyme